MTTNNNSVLASLCQQWRAIKDQEQECKARRLDLEQQIIALTGKPDEGQKTLGLGYAKITIKANHSYSFDWAKWDAELAAQIPPHMHPIKTERAIDEGGFKYLRQHEPALYAIASLALTKKEIKPSLDITLL